MNKQILIFLASFLIFTGCTGTMPELGVNNGKLRQCPTTPNCVNSQAKDKKHFIEPISITATTRETKNYLLKMLNEWKQANVVEVEDNYIRAEFVSNLFRFVDDVEFYFPDTKSGDLLIHVRSASRVGYFDFGVNRKRIEKIRKKLEQSFQRSR